MFGAEHGPTTSAFAAPVAIHRRVDKCVVLENMTSSNGLVSPGC